MDAFSAERWRRAALWAEARRGLARIEDLRALGIGRGAVEKAVRSRRLVRVHHGIYAFGHAPLDRETEWLAAVLACGDSSALSHRSAAAAWEIRRGEFSVVEVTAPTGRGRSRTGIRVHQSPLDPHERVEHRGIPMTSVARTLADLAHELDEDDLVRTVREAQYRRLFHLASVELANRRRPSAALTRLLADLAPAESWLEDRFLTRVVARHRLPAPECQVRVEGFRVDFLWREPRLIVEVDGMQHADPLRMRADRIRDNALHLAGFLVLRFTTPDITRFHARTARQIIRGLRR
jgi:very-short-patch-repair endonuclease